MKNGSAVEKTRARARRRAIDAHMTAQQPAPSANIPDNASEPALAEEPSPPAPLPDFEARYTELVSVGEREFACTFSGLDSSSGQRVFLKVLRANRRDDALANWFFTNEPAILRLLAREAPHVPVLPVLDTGVCSWGPYFALPLLSGWSLDHALKTARAFTGQTTLAVIEGGLEFLSLLHGAGIVHGDISPDNVFVETLTPPPADGHLAASFAVRLVDFNSARRFNGPENQHQIPPFLKRAYAAPEAVEGQPLSPSSDLFALGVVFYELLAGERPFFPDLQGSQQPSVAPIPLVCEVPSLVEQLVRSLLAPEPRDRPSSAHEALGALRSLKSLHYWLSQTTGPELATLLPRAEGPRFEARSRSGSAVGTGLADARSRTDLGASFRTPITVPRPQAGTGSARSESSVDRSEASLVFDVPVPHHDSMDLVDFSVFAPASVAPSTSFILEVWAYMREDQAEVLQRATRDRARIERGSRRAVHLPSATRVTLLLRLDDFEVLDAQDSFYWNGGYVNVGFIVKVPPQLPAGIYPGQVSILHNGALLSRLLFDLQVGAPIELTGPRNVRRQQFRSAFASYASADRPEVLRRVQGLSAAGVDVFLDVLSLRAGDDWEQSIVESIRSRDIFYLFWSMAASRSEWVGKEWRYALREKGLDSIHPIPLVDPRQVPPPSELATRHFNDLILLYLEQPAAL
jgi:serine/threonine protein kinase